MKTIRSILFCLVAMAPLAHAQSAPEDVVDQYFRAFRAGDIESMAALMHPDELASMKQELIPIIAQGIDAVESGTSVDPLQLKLFSDTDSIEVISEESPEDFFVRFMSWINRMNPMMQESIRDASIQTIGHVTEGENIAHVVYRISVMAQGARVTQVNVMPAKKSDEEWRLMMSGEIKGISSLLKQKMPRF
jgi:hypothetical protein